MKKYLTWFAIDWEKKQRGVVISYETQETLEQLMVLPEDVETPMEFLGKVQKLLVLDYPTAVSALGLGECPTTPMATPAKPRPSRAKAKATEATEAKAPEAKAPEAKATETTKSEALGTPVYYRKGQPEVQGWLLQAWREMANGDDSKFQALYANRRDMVEASLSGRTQPMGTLVGEVFTVAPDLQDSWTEKFLTGIL